MQDLTHIYILTYLHCRLNNLLYSTFQDFALLEVESEFVKTVNTDHHVHATSARLCYYASMSRPTEDNNTHNLGNRHLKIILSGALIQ